MGKHQKKGPKPTPLFDIRLRSTDKDVVVLKGSEDDAPSVLLSGVIALSVVEPITIKRMQLKLWASLKFNWEEKYQSAKSTYTRPYRYQKVLFEFDWDPLNLQEFLSNNNRPLSSSYSGFASDGNMISSGSGFATGTLTRSTNSSSSSLKMMAHTSKSSSNLNKNKSLTNLSSLSFTSSNKNEPVVLQQGNYEFPFQTILDGSIPESVEGLPGCSVVYRLQSTIERHRFSAPIITRKHIHVVRTLTTDAPELTETVAVENTWPQKVDYSISVPARAIAIGSTCPIDMTMVPLAKGLQLGSIKISLNENFSFSTTYSSHVGERTVLNKTIPKIVTDQNGKNVWTEAEMDENGVFFRNEEMSLAQDKWEIRSSVNIPSSLAQVTQDCMISHYVRVIHKLRFVVSLINTDGHVSELRATLPITLFISPFVPIKAKNLPDLDDDLASANVEDATIRYKGDELMFGSDGLGLLSSTASTPGSSFLSASAPAPAYNFNAQELMAPPNYENHVYDRLWSGVNSPADTPEFSQPSTPRGQADPASQAVQASSDPSPDSNQLSEFNMTATEGGFSNQLLASLNRVHSSQQPATRGRAVFNLTDEGTDYFSYNSPTEHTDTTIAGPAFSGGAAQPAPETPGIAINNQRVTPGILSPVQHLSRANSYIESASGADGEHPEEIKWDGELLSRVPSYETAIKSDVTVGDLTPAYEPSENGSYINLDQLDSRLNDVHISQGNHSHHHHFPIHPKLSRSTTSSSILLNLGRHKDHKLLASELAKSRASSKTPSPSLSRNHSTANISTPRSAHQHSSSMGSGQTSPLLSTSPGISQPKGVHLHLSTHGAPGSSSADHSSSQNEPSHTAMGALKRPELVKSRSASSFHLNMSKKNGSLSNLSFLHKKKQK
ncbi:hypothetical protein KL918_005152 [Ogataea parapolymorpha]|uniref:Protein ROG3 n=1 Tax=Ogataea parapolymorpha (strain ATCC 26012 / BCRC 20466 / JCM 22074 / NRRL Y-7560 / DL-1) TaxID=871575 RepID=W1QD08_OGAPD|nr:Protein ROG3 [Ogataea parapolymorpha DL-1]ESW98429.1 Protein ROG3 [Ogataea parapolymorpha DL-1]KAG7864831.1 hypothetical protein KL918_005152 [Ogataea parapolymorpha]KAG7873335.1 hypothetical protein KL916_002284 [Ogataea parapolymorpha]